jgi:hypothetical protein
MTKVKAIVKRRNPCLVVVDEESSEGRAVKMRNRLIKKLQINGTQPGTTLGYDRDFKYAKSALWLRPTTVINNK